MRFNSFNQIKKYLKKAAHLDNEKFFGLENSHLITIANRRLLRSAPKKSFYSCIVLYTVSMYFDDFSCDSFVHSAQGVKIRNDTTDRSMPTYNACDR